MGSKINEITMEIFKLFFDDNWSMVLHIHSVALVVIFVVSCILLYKYRKLYFFENVEIDSAEIGLGNQKITIKPNYTNINIAYKLWVELSTRKIGIEIDFEDDVILEIYQSWYKFFKITRGLIKELPANKIRSDKDSKALVELSIKILNTDLRRHLTKWQARYHKWHETKKYDDDKTPQQLQQDFPNYKELTVDMIKVNKRLIMYKNDVYKLAFGANI